MTESKMSDYEGDCTVGRPIPWWHRFIPGFAWDAWWTVRLAFHDFSEGRRMRRLGLSSERNRRLVQYVGVHLDRLTDEQKDQLILAWRDVLGIKPIKTRHLRYCEPDIEPPTPEERAELHKALEDWANGAIMVYPRDRRMVVMGRDGMDDQP